MTPHLSSQRILFRALSRKIKDFGHVIRFNYMIGPYWADIYIHPYWIIEVDGPEHFSPKAREKDEVRTKYLESMGKRVLRITNEQVSNDLLGCVEESLSFVMPHPRYVRKKNR